MARSHTNSTKEKQRNVPNFKFWEFLRTRSIMNCSVSFFAFSYNHMHHRGVRAMASQFSVCCYGEPLACACRCDLHGIPFEFF